MRQAATRTTTLRRGHDFVEPPSDRGPVDLEHRGFEAYGERAAEMRETYGSDGGWGGLMRAFAAAADGGAA